MMFILGFCCGVIVLGIIADKAHKAQIASLEERIRTDGENNRILEEENRRLQRELETLRAGTDASKEEDHGEH